MVSRVRPPGSSSKRTSMSVSKLAPSGIRMVET
jgi:hypothetical protein